MLWAGGGKTLRGEGENELLFTLRAQQTEAAALIPGSSK